MSNFMNKNDMNVKMMDLGAQAAEMMITHNGEHKHHLLDAVDKLKTIVEASNLPITADTFTAMFIGGKMFNEFTEDEEDEDGFLLLGTFLAVAKYVREQKKVPVASDSKETKIPVKTVKPTKSTIQPKDLK